MNIIFVARSHGKARSLQLGNRWLIVVGLVLMLVLASAFVAGYRAASEGEDVIGRKNYISSWQQDLQQKGEEIEKVKRESDEQLKSLAVRMAELHAKLIRLDALGEHLAKSAELDAEEFSFAKSPALGGPEDGDSSEQFKAPSFIVEIEQLSRAISLREQELEVLNQLLGDKALEDERYISGRPVKWGWLSSKFGRRTDPFSGRLAWHEGVDFAGREDSDIISVAAGVVTWSGERQGYGNMIEINHGGNLATRYAHANELLVEVGEVVEKGQTVARMGSTGRSTGPHVHFEVLKNGNPVDPYRYVKRRKN